jgi:hypothetical protein
MLHSDLPTYGPMKYFELLIITALCALQCILFPWTLSSAPYLYLTQHMMYDTFCKHLKVSLITCPCRQKFSY